VGGRGAPPPPPALIFEFTDVASRKNQEITASQSLEIFFSILEFTTIFEKSSKKCSKKFSKVLKIFGKVLKIFKNLLKILKIFLKKFQKFSRKFKKFRKKS
jgi:hypothetical protein